MHTSDPITPDVDEEALVACVVAARKRKVVELPIPYRRKPTHQRARYRRQKASVAGYFRCHAKTATACIPGAHDKRLFRRVHARTAPSQLIPSEEMPQSGQERG